MKKIKKQFKNISELNPKLVIFLTIGLIACSFLLRKNIYLFERFGYLGIVVINLLSSATVIFPTPGIATTFLAGALWNPVLVGLFSGLGASIGEISGYLVGLSTRGIAYKRLVKSNSFHFLQTYFDKGGFVTILIMALIPVPIFDFVGIIAGTVQYPLWKFVLATFIGRSIRNYLIAYSGAKILPI